MDVAVVVAHPDDEVLGFGGVMARHADAGDRVHVLILATGLAARTDTDAAEPGALDALRGQAQAAAAILGVRRLEFADFPDNRMDTVALLDVVKRVETFLAAAEMRAVYTHHRGDLNVDHRICHDAVLTACRPLPGSTVARLLAGEVLSASEYGLARERLEATVYIDIGAQLERKCNALACYAGELRPWPHPRSIAGVRHLAALRGCEAGLQAAEAFALLRERVC